MSIRMSDAKATLAFVAGREGLWIEFHEQAFPGAELAWDRDAIVAAVRVRADPFYGGFTTLIWSHELVNLQRQLDLLWQRFGQTAQAQIRLWEGTLHLSFEVTQRGQVCLSVEARSDPTATTSLHFMIEAEYIALQIWSNEIGNVLEQFPPEKVSKPANP